MTATAAAFNGLHLVDERPPGPGLTDFALWLRANGCGERTIFDRLEHVEDFTRHNPSFPHVKAMHITAWIGRPGFAPWSRATYFGHLRSYFTFALENDLLAVDPMARMRRPKPPRGVPRPLTAEQVDLLLATAKPNMRTRLILGLYAGLRAHEMAKIRGEDVAIDGIYVLGKGGVFAQIPTHPLIWEEALTRPKVSWWFPSNTARGHVSPLSVSTGASRHFTACGIEGSIHRCRHTYATELLRAGVNVRVVQTLMRHRSLESTMIYTAGDEDEQVDGIGRLGARWPAPLGGGDHRGGDVMSMARRPFADSFSTAEALSRQISLTVLDLLEREHIPVTVAAANLGISWETLTRRFNTTALLVTDLEALAAMVDTRVSTIVQTAEAAAS